MKSTPLNHSPLRYWTVCITGSLIIACTFTSTVLTPPPQPGGQIQPAGTFTSTRTPTRPFQTPVTRRPTDTPTLRPTINLPTSSPPPMISPLPNGKLLLEDDFQVKKLKPLFDESAMTLEFSSMGLRLRGSKPGVLPAMYPTPLPADFLAEVDIKADTIAIGSHYGFVFRSTSASNPLSQYYLGVIYFNARKMGIYAMQDGKWVTTRAENMPPALNPRAGDYNRVRLEAIDGNFRFFINQEFAASFHDTTLTLKEGGFFGLFLSTDTSRPAGISEAVFYRNLKVYERYQSSSR